jgi:hypothetical protein
VIRGVDERVADVWRLVMAARAAHDDRARLAPAIARSTGLTPAGVELGFSCLERDATASELRSLVTTAGDTTRVHLILSANVFVAPLRALAIARAAAAQVTVRPSPRDPTLTRALVDAAGDGGIQIVGERDVAAIEAGQIHVYGRDETIAAVRARAAKGVPVRGHGAGLGVAVVTRAADVRTAADELAADVVPFDQRGCLSPRIAIVEGDASRGEAFALALHARLSVWGERVPRGDLWDAERADAARWCGSLAFAGRLWSGSDHAVGLAQAGSPLTVPPPGRHVHVATEGTLDDVAARISPILRFVVGVGTDDPLRVREVAPSHARVGPLGLMQRPRLDGPVDRRSL